MLGLQGLWAGFAQLTGRGDLQIVASCQVRLGSFPLSGVTFHCSSRAWFRSRHHLLYSHLAMCRSSEIQKLQLGSVLDLRVLKRPCKKHAEDAYHLVKRTESRNGAASAGSTGLSTGSGSSDEVCSHQL